MPRFYYQALTADEQTQAGQLQAASLAEAVAQLEAQGLIVQSIGSTRPAGTLGGESPFARDDVSRRVVERAVLEQHLQTVLQRGREVLPALRAYAQELPAGRRRRQLDSVLQILERGDAADAAATLATLPGYWIPLLAAATAARDPGRILREFVDESERALELQRQWWLALSYPALLGGLALAVLSALSLFVIPVFREIFGGFGLKLPEFTQLVLAIADWIASGRILLVLAALLAAAILIWQLSRLLPTRVRHWWSDHIGMRWGRATSLARFSQFAADLLEADLETPQAVRLAGLATGNPPLRRAASRVAGDLEAGGDFMRPGNRHVLTATVLHALDGGVSATARIRLLREISACYAERARSRLSWTRGIVEPLAICAIGLVVGATVLALFLPLISLIHGLS